MRVMLCWLIAAAAVATIHAQLSASLATAATTAVIIVCAYCYTRFCAPCGGFNHALGVGVAWLLLGIVSEIVMTTQLGRGWYAILGRPDRPLLRNITLLVWTFAPALFARQEDIP